MFNNLFLSLFVWKTKIKIGFSTCAIDFSGVGNAQINKDKSL